MDLSTHRAGTGHLTYCSNIHAGESWQEVLSNLRTHIPGIKAKLSPDAPFGIGLRLSAEAAATLSKPSSIADLRTFLNEHDCYIFTLNGFPYGTFHGEAVKENVYLPDWKDTSRLHYSNTLADAFAEFLPPNMTGSISTVPGAFKSSVANDEDIAQMTLHFVQQVAHLVELERKTGKHMVLALEPEPCCYLETIEESIEYFTQHLYAHDACEQLGRLVSVDTDVAEDLLRTHLTLCLDLCHAAVEFESCDDCIDALEHAGIAIGKVQISAGLRLPNFSAKNKTLLTPFIDEVYLHQVVEQHNGTLNRYPDLPEALAALGDSEESREWRVHFHVPIFLDDLGEFSSTQFFVQQALERHRRKPLSEHLEVETYTWDVLPAAYRTASVDDAIVRELDWVINTLGVQLAKAA